MTRYMLDTNMVSHLLKAHPLVTQRVIALPMAALCISAITEGELLFGLTKRPEAKQLQCVVLEFLRRVETHPWDSAAAAHYGMLHADMARQGKGLSALDMLIAAHALSLGAVLVTNDQAFAQIEQLLIEDWTA
ncbi:MAG: type II toxin-antitoxin system VapC family toxin [Halothiobacillaceae bacterium]